MASVLFTVDDPVMNALAFSSTNSLFSKLRDHGEKKSKIDDLAFIKLHRARDVSNKDRIKCLNFTNNSMREKNEAKAYINNVDETMLEYYQVFVKQIRTLPPGPQLSNLYCLSQGQKNVVLPFFTVGTGLATYPVY